MSDLKRKLKAGENLLSNDQTALQVQLSGKPRPFIMDTRWMFYRLFGTNDISQTVLHTHCEVNVEPFVQEVLTKGWEIINKKRYHVIEEGETKPAEYVLAHSDGFLIEIGVEYRSLAENVKKREYTMYGMPDGEICYFSSIVVLHTDTEAHDAVIKNLTDAMKTHSLTSSKGASIGIISSDNGDYYVKNFSLEGKTPSFTYPDLHYGKGFEEFHTSLLDRLKNKTKGLVLLHGEPGTGKTQYIRVLLKELALINKSILYAPPSLSASLTDPDVIEFISDWVLEEERDCILLIEDAEPLLEARSGFDGRSTGISNLLNMTDGLLNDILGLTVIATFNIHISKIDPALLRPQRLVARKEFNKISEEQLGKLAKELNMELPDIKYPASLAEFYSANTENAILVHSIKEEPKIGFNIK
jgi:hypothetical protein